MMENKKQQTVLELAVREVAKQLYRQGILKSPISQKGQLEMIDKIDKIEDEIIKRYST